MFVFPENLSLFCGKPGTLILLHGRAPERGRTAVVKHRGSPGGLGAEYTKMVPIGNRFLLESLEMQQSYLVL